MDFFIVSLDDTSVTEWRIFPVTTKCHQLDVSLDDTSVTEWRWHTCWVLIQINVFHSMIPVLLNGGLRYSIKSVIQHSFHSMIPVLLNGGAAALANTPRLWKFHSMIPVLLNGGKPIFQITEKLVPFHSMIPVLLNGGSRKLWWCFNDSCCFTRWYQCYWMAEDVLSRRY